MPKPLLHVLLVSETARKLLEKEKKLTKTTDENGWSPLHIAAIRGLVDVMKEIVSRCPACCELVDNRGWNALHYVVAVNFHF
jgi:ankyrin repeat protein